MFLDLYCSHTFYFQSVHFGSKALPPTGVFVLCVLDESSFVNLLNESSLSLKPVSTNGFSSIK